MASFAGSVIFIGILTTIIVKIILYYVRRLPLYKVASKFVGPPSLPFLGNSLYFMGNTADILDKIMELFNTYPSPFRVWLGSRLFFATWRPNDLQVIFTSPKTLEKEDLYKFVRPWLGTGLFTAPMAKWRIHRKLIMPTFNQRILESFVEVFAVQAEIMVTKMEAELGKGEFEIFDYISPCTLDIICETAMGVTVHAQTQKKSRYVEYAKRLFEILFTRMFHIWLHPDFIFNRTKSGRDQQKCLKYLHGVTNDVIQKKKSLLESYQFQNGGKDESIDYIDRKRKAFLDLLMELSYEGTKFTDEELREEVDTMMIAGNDTTAMVNCWVLLMLAYHPEVQEKVYQELCEIYEPDKMDAPVTHEDLNRMEYLERTIKETLRIFPVGPILVRRVTEELQLDNHTLPKGSSVVLGILKVHRSPDYWPDPFKFDPERFLPEEVAKRHPFCYVPFSAGPRNCIGGKYAMMAMKALLSTVVRKYVLKKDNTLPIADIKLKADIMLKSVDPMTLRLERRHPANAGS